VEAEVAASLEVVSRAAKKSTTFSSKFWMDRYLKAVYQLYLQLRRKKLARSLPRQIARQSGVRTTRSAHPLQVLIKTTCPIPDAKVQSRWGRALQYAAHQRIKPRRLKTFVRRSGGLSGCARAMAQVKPRRRPVRQWP
jgi:hypothetical protein